MCYLTLFESNFIPVYLGSLVMPKANRPSKTPRFRCTGRGFLREFGPGNPCAAFLHLKAEGIRKQ